MTVTVQTPLTLAATATTGGALAAGKHTPTDATSGALTMTLPAPARAGARLRVEKTDTTTNPVTISGTIRGAANSVTLTSQYETVELFAESLTSWRVAGSHRTKTATDAAYAAKAAGVPTGGTGTTFLRGDGTWAAPAGGGGSVPDASTTTKGVVQLAGDLAGTAAAPTVPGLAGKLTAASNLSDVASAATARTNLGLGTAATSAAAAFDAAGAATTAAALRAPLLVPTATKTAAYTAAVGDLAMMNVAGGGTALTLPIAPANKSQVGYRAIGATTGVPLTVTAGGTDTIGTAGAATASIPLADETAVLQYDAANTRWLAVANVKTQASLDSRFVQVGAQQISVKDYGAKGDGQTVYNVTSATGSATVTVSSGTPFAAGDVGKLAVVWTSSAAGTITTIQAVNSATSITLAASAGITTSGAGFLTWGTDDSAAIQAALAAAAAKSALVSTVQTGYVPVILPATAPQSSYIIRSQINIPGGVIWDGPATVWNMLANRNLPCITLARQSRVRQMVVEALWGTGVRAGVPGDYATIVIDDIRIGHCSGVPSAAGQFPTGLAVTGSATGGTLGAGTYFYVVTGVDAGGAESVVSNEVWVVNTGSTSSNALTWTGDAAFASYKVYRGSTARGERQWYAASGTSFTDTGAAAGSGPPVPPGVGLALFGYHYEIGRILVGNATIGIYQQSTDTSINSADLIGCATGWRGYAVTNTSCPTVILDTIGGTDANGYVTEGGIVFDFGCAHITLKVKAFQTFPKTCSPVVGIGPYTNNQCGNLDIDVRANNVGGTVLALANCKASTFGLTADNTAYNGASSLPITTGVAYGGNLRSDLRVRATLDPTVTTSSTGTVVGQFEYLQNGSLGSNLASATPNVDGPSDNGQVTWTDDPQHIGGTFVPTSGVVYLSRVLVRQAATVTNLATYVGAGGGNLVSGQCFLGLYNSSGTLVASTADVQSSFSSASTVQKTVAVTTPTALPSGTYYVAQLYNWATTGPSIGRTGTTNINFGRGVAPYRWMTSGTGQTALPASIALSSGGSTSNATWASVS